jgi:acyl-CoA reductase-like NAD-dependent aldehyde dehydrogenase
MFIDGRHVDAAEVYEIRHPASEELVHTVAKGTAEHVDLAVAAARESFRKRVWAGVPPDERAEVLRRIGQRLNDDVEELVALEIQANGATIRQALGFHVGLASSHFLYFAELAATFAFEQEIVTSAYPTLSANRIVREPIGVCAAIVPWNFPLILGIWKVGPALAAGNSVVVKTDEKAPLSLLRLAEIAHEEGLPSGVLNVITGDGLDAGRRLASHPDVAKVAFTGSTAVGREVMRLASGTVKKVSLELGGKGPVVLLDDADLDIAVDGILFGCMLYSGQICASGTRLLVPAVLYEEVVNRLVARAGTIRVGDPGNFDTDMGPVISARQRDQILRFIGQAVAEGATVALGGGAPAGEEFQRGFWVAPTILTNVTNDMEIAREEVFGPVLAVLRYEGLDEAIAIANDSAYGLTAGVWAGDYERALEVSARLDAGTVWINNWHMIDPALPFGGCKHSGVGRELGPDALQEYTEPKHVHLDLTQSKNRHMFDILLSTP